MCSYGYIENIVLLIIEDVLKVATNLAVYEISNNVVLTILVLNMTAYKITTCCSRENKIFSVA